MTIQYSAIARGDTILVSHLVGDNHLEDVAISMLKNIPVDRNTKITYTSSNFLFHVCVENQLIFMCVAEPSFQKRIPFAYLEEIKSKFNQTSLGSRAYSARNHEFDQDFQYIMSQEMDRYSSGETGDQLSQLKLQVEDVKGVMTQNIDKVLQRGEKLDDLVSKTEDLQECSLKFRSTSKRVARKMWWRNMRMWAIIIIVFCIIITFIVLFATGTIPTS